MSVVVYSKESCVQCSASKKLLVRQGVDFTEVRVDLDSKALDFVKGLGYMSAPVIVLYDHLGAVLDHWAGFVPERLKSLKNLSQKVE